MVPLQPGGTSPQPCNLLTALPLFVHTYSPSSFLFPTRSCPHLMRPALSISSLRNRRRLLSTHHPHCRSPNRNFFLQTIIRLIFAAALASFAVANVDEVPPSPPHTHPPTVSPLNADLGEQVSNDGETFAEATAFVQSFSSMVPPRLPSPRT